MRDEGALASALMRPQLGYYDSLIEEAAALMESLANDHLLWTATGGMPWQLMIRFCG